MSTENEAVVQRFFEEFCNQRRAEVADEIIAADYVAHGPQSPPAEGPEGVKVRVTRPGTSAVADSTTTDKFGSYKLLVKDEGKSVLTVVYEKQRLELPVFSNKEATRYDLILETSDGKLMLRRK